MKRFIRELRRREVFRTAGLYVGICWILIEVSSVMLPTFDAPEWILQWIIIAAFVGFPVMLVLAWVYDITDEGVEVQADAADTVVAPLGSRKMDFVVIGVLTVALVFSVSMNIRGGKSDAVPPQLVSVLIADFRNETGNPLFDGLLEQALNIGIESAPNVTAFERNGALELATRLQPDTEALDTVAATLVAVREGIQLVLAGSIQSSGDGYELSVDGVDPGEAQTLFEISGKAGSAEAVLQVVGELSQEVREELGDTTLDSSDNPIAETFTAASLEAAKAYTTALQLAYEGDHDSAVVEYRKATELDPNFGRAFSGWALSEFKLGRTDEATAHWDKALSLMDTMTERERLRTLGLYYAGVTRNYENAVQSFSELIEKYPADAAGLNNLAVSAFLTLDFETASTEGKKLLEIYPSSRLYRSNYTLYAMYSGDFAEASRVANEMVSEDPDYGVPFLPLAMVALDSGDFDAARDAYGRMRQSTTGTYRESHGWLGLADIALYTGRFDEADELLASGIAVDEADENTYAQAVKTIALAESHLAQGRLDEAKNTARLAIELSGGDSTRVAAARIFTQAGDIEAASAIADELVAKLQPQSRAYGQMLNAMIARSSGDLVGAVDGLRGALEFADFWLIRFELGRTYVEGEFFAEALSELMLAQERRGEATAVFLDDMPSYRYLATLPYWTARAQQGVGMGTSYVEGYEAFLALRPEGGPLADDARQRLP